MKVLFFRVKNLQQDGLLIYFTKFEKKKSKNLFNKLQHMKPHYLHIKYFYRVENYFS